MRILTTVAILAGVFGPLAPAFAADLDDYPPPPPAPYYERGPVPPAFVPGPVVYRPPVLRPYGFYRPRRLVRIYGEPRVYGEPSVYGAPRLYGEGYGPRPPRAYGEPGFERDRTIVRRDREEFGREGYGHDGYGRGRDDAYVREHETARREGYGHYLSHGELEHRAERGGISREHDAERDGGYGRNDRFAERGGRDFDR